MAVSKRRSRETWRAEVNAWIGSGLTSEEYSADVGISAQRLCWWRREFDSESSFVEVSADRLEPAPRGEGVDILVGDVVVHVPVGFEAATLSRVLDLFGVQR